MKIEIENNISIKISDNKKTYNYYTQEIKNIFISKKGFFPFKKYHLVIILINGKKIKYKLKRKHKEEFKKFVIDYNYNSRKKKHAFKEL